MYLKRNQTWHRLTFGRHGGVSKTQEGSETIATEIALAAGSFAANGSSLLAVPGGHRLYGATHRYDLGVFGAVFPLVGVSKTETEWSRQRQRHIKLVI